MKVLSDLQYRSFFFFNYRFNYVFKTPLIHHKLLPLNRGWVFLKSEHAFCLFFNCFSLFFFFFCLSYSITMTKLLHSTYRHPQEWSLHNINI